MPMYLYIYIYIIYIYYAIYDFYVGEFVRIPHNLQSSFGTCMPQFASATEKQNLNFMKKLRKIVILHVLSRKIGAPYECFPCDPSIKKSP